VGLIIRRQPLAAAMGDLAADTAVQGADGRFVADLSSEWEIWGPSGGYVASVALRAAAAHAGFERPASFSCHFLSVARFEQVQIDVRTLRTSRRAESVAVSMSQDGTNGAGYPFSLAEKLARITEAHPWYTEAGAASSPWAHPRRMLANDVMTVTKRTIRTGLISGRAGRGCAPSRP